MYKLLDKFFCLKKNNTRVMREIVAGATSFLTLSYVLVLIPSILSEIGMDFGAMMAATTLIGAYSSLTMGLVANYPFVLAPSITLCAYFTYAVVLHGGDEWQTTLGVIFITGILLLILNLLRIRQLIIRVIPHNLRFAITGGLGLFLALIGLKNADIIVIEPGRWLSFGDPTSISLIMTAVGIVIMGTLMVFRVPGALLLGMVIIWLMSWILGFASFEEIASWPVSLKPTLFQLNVRDAFEIRHLGVLISFLFLTLFDSSGSLLGLAEEGLFVKEEKNLSIFPRISRALIPDTTGTILAPLLGTTPVAVYPESAAGISAGGRTGLTAITGGILFLLALFFAPLTNAIPPFATAPVLIIVGALMLKKVIRINWKDPSEWIAAFLTLILIPLTYSIAVGIAVGYITYCLIKLFTAKVKEVHWFSWVLAILFALKFIFFPKI